MASSRDGEAVGRSANLRSVPESHRPVLRVEMTWCQAAEFVWQHDDHLNDLIPFREQLLSAACEMGYVACITEGDVVFTREGEAHHRFIGDECFSVAHQFLRAELACNAVLSACEYVPWTPGGLTALCRRRDIQESAE